MTILTLNSCQLADVVTHTKEEGIELVDYSTEQVGVLLNETADRLDGTIEKAAQQIGTALREVLDADVIAFAAVSIIVLLIIWMIIWGVLQWRRNK
jgi:hypothetical protein